MSHGLKRKQTDQADVELPITPMLDMTFQLMAFFIMTYHPTAQEGQISMTLPLPKTNTTGNPETNKDLELKSTVTVFVNSDSGDISGLSIKQGNSNEPVSFGTELKDLGKGLKDVAAREKQSVKLEDVSLKIAVGARVKYIHVIAVMDLCLQAGFTQLGFESFDDAIRK